MKKRAKVFGTIIGAMVIIGACSATGTEEKAQPTNTQQTQNQEPQKQEAPKPKEEAPKAAKMNKAKFDQIKNGMSIEEVNAIVGGAGELMSEGGEGQYKFSMYTWEGEGSLGANANVSFQADKVSAKAQFGLK
ncbi:beta-lactamase-inhibitor domain containing protein [Bacillus phage vB_BceS-M2]